MPDGIPELDAAIRARHLLKHPFYRAWSSGELPMENLREYAKQYYHFEREFPRYVASAYSKLTDPVGRRVLLENLIDEEGRDPTHPELWLQFANSIGVRRDAVVRSRPRPTTASLRRAYERMTFDGTAPEALGALYSYESIFPEVAAEKSRGLRENYHITDPQAHEFFRVHTDADVAHSGAERKLLRRELQGHPRARNEALAAAERAMTGWWRFLDDFTP